MYTVQLILVINGKSNRKVIENYLLLYGSVYHNYLLLDDFDYLLLITGYYFGNRSITYYFSITYYLLPHVCSFVKSLHSVARGAYVRAVLFENGIREVPILWIHLSIKSDFILNIFLV